MIDVNALLRRWISEGLNTQRVSATVLPEWHPETQDGFNPSAGPWIVVSRVAGQAHPEAPVIRPHMQVRVWADVNQFDVAAARSLQIYDLIHGQTSVDFGDDGFVISCMQDIGDQDVTDTDSAFATVISFYDLQCTSNEFRS